MQEVTFQQFREVVERRGHMAASLTEQFKGIVENPRELFERVMAKGVAHQNVVIPYRSILKFYAEQSHFLKDSEPNIRRCSCGCGSPVFGQHKFANETCRKRAYRQKSET